MANPDPSPETRFKPGNKASLGAKPGKRATTILLELIAEKNADRAIGAKWLERILNGDFRYHKEYLDRIEGKVPDRIAGYDGGPIGQGAEALGTALIVELKGESPEARRAVAKALERLASEAATVEPPALPAPDDGHGD